MYAVSYLVPSFLSGMNHDSLMLGYECFGISIGGLVRGHLFQRSVPDLLFVLYLILAHLCIIISVILFLVNSKSRTMALISGILGSASNWYWFVLAFASEGIEDLLPGYFLWLGASMLIYTLAIYKAFFLKSKSYYMPKSRLGEVIDSTS